MRESNICDENGEAWLIEISPVVTPKGKMVGSRQPVLPCSIRSNAGSPKSRGNGSVAAHFYGVASVSRIIRVSKHKIEN
jgi:hypothetical protein